MFLYTTKKMGGTRGKMHNDKPHVGDEMQDGGLDSAVLRLQGSHTMNMTSLPFLLRDPFAPSHRTVAQAANHVRSGWALPFDWRSQGGK